MSLYPDSAACDRCGRGTDVSGYRWCKPCAKFLGVAQWELAPTTADPFLARLKDDLKLTGADLASDIRTTAHDFADDVRSTGHDLMADIRKAVRR